MAVQETGKAPYAPTTAFKTWFEQNRTRTIPTPVTNATLERLGIEPSLTSRTLAALKQLDLLTEEGNLTPAMNKIAVAPTDELQSVMAEWLREAYKPIFAFVEPSDDVQRIADQFRPYEPRGMTNRMVTLFLGLSHEAGLIDALPTMPRSKVTITAGSSRSGKYQPTAKQATNKHATPKPEAPPSTSAEAVRDRYVAMLIERAEKQEQLDPDLLDRIERALGIAEAAL